MVKKLAIAAICLKVSDIKNVEFRDFSISYIETKDYEGIDISEIKKLKGLFQMSPSKWPGGG